MPRRRRAAIRFSGIAAQAEAAGEEGRAVGDVGHGLVALRRQSCP